MKSSTYYFHMKMKILADFPIYISVPLNQNKKKLSVTFKKNMLELITIQIGEFEKRNEYKCKN